jgi:hypothetical protein
MRRFDVGGRKNKVMKKQYSISFPARAIFSLTFEVEAESTELADELASQWFHGDFINYDDPDAELTPDYSTVSMADGTARLCDGYRLIEEVETHA